MIAESNSAKASDQHHISFRPLVEQDLEMLCNWLNSPHLRSHYQKSAISLDAVIQKYSPRINHAHAVKCHIATYENQPFGLIQSYRIKDFPDFAEQIKQADGVAIDLFIGDAIYMGKGLGKKMLQSYALDVIPTFFPYKTCAFICHSKSNQVALQSSVAAGFRKIRDVFEDGEESVLLALDIGHKDNG